MGLLGIYEKALPKGISWYERLMMAKELGFDFVEISVDETDDRLLRLDWTKEQRQAVRQAIFDTQMPILSMCLSGHRRFPFGSHDENIRQEALIIMDKAIQLALDLGIRSIQLAGYDVYYEDKDVTTRAYFLENLQKAVSMASAKGIVLSIEIMDDPFMSSITKFLKIKEQIPSPYLQVYPDLGNLSAWGENDVSYELEKGFSHINQIHLKDTLAVTKDFAGKFKEVPFGAGCVDFVGCFKTLKQLNYNGPMVIEMWSENTNYPAAAVKEAKSFILGKMQEADYLEQRTNYPTNERACV